MIDDTNGFLLDGYIQVQMPEIEAKYYKDDKVEGYVWRVTLVKSEYDVAPLVKSISNFLFPAIQKETLVIAHTFQKSSSVTIKSHLLEDGFVKVFCKEKKGSSRSPCLGTRRVQGCDGIHCRILRAAAAGAG